jgi:hypothetical protein
MEPRPMVMSSFMTMTKATKTTTEQLVKTKRHFHRALLSPLYCRPHWTSSHRLACTPAQACQVGPHRHLALALALALVEGMLHQRPLSTPTPTPARCSQR